MEIRKGTTATNYSSIDEENMMVRVEEEEDMSDIGKKQNNNVNMWYGGGGVVSGREGYEKNSQMEFIEDCGAF